MASSEDLFAAQIQAELARVHPDLARDWEFDPRSSSFRVASPVEPCGQCGHRVYLILVDGETEPRWERIGPVRDADTLFPQVMQIRHECGDGDAWSVEAALFAEQTLVEWGIAA